MTDFPMTFRNMEAKSERVFRDVLVVCVLLELLYIYIYIYIDMRIVA